MDFLTIDRDDGGVYPVTVNDSDTGSPADLSVMDLLGAIEWAGGSLSMTIANSRLAENADTPLSGGLVDLVFTRTDARSLPTGKTLWLTMQDMTPGAEETIIPRLPVRII